MMEGLTVWTDAARDPIGLQNRCPVFSWRYPEGVSEQASYRVCVSSDAAKAAAGVYDLWDSGVVESRDCFGVAYAGEPLRSRTEAFVSVRTRSAEGLAYEGAARFETGLLDPSDWKGGWVSVPSNFPGETLRFRKRFRLDRPVRRVRAYVCGIGYHEVYLNGRKQGDARLNPGVTAYDRRVLYSVYCLDGDLAEGDNVLGVEVGYGFYGNRKLLLQMYVEFEDGTVLEDCTANGAWWASGSPTVRNSLYGGETYDARREEGDGPTAWATTAFEPTWANGWMYSLRVPAPGGVPEAQTVNEIRETGAYAPISQRPLPDGTIVYDIGQNLAGWVRLRTRGARGARVTLRFGERLKEDGSVNRLNLRSARAEDVYILKGIGEEEWAPRFTYHGFRYVQAEIEGRAEILSLTAEHVHSDVRPCGAFESDDETLNRLHRNAVMTELNNLHSIMTDCPQRDERFGWLNDLGSRLYQTVYNCGMERFFPKVARDITDTADDEGGIADTAPFFTGGRPADPVSVAYLLMAAYAYRYYGDASVARREYEGMRRWTEFLLSRSDGFLMQYYYYADWVAPGSFPDVQTNPLLVSSFYLRWHLKLMAEIAAICGREEDARRFRELTAASTKALHAAYYDAGRRCYGSGTQTENALALSMGVCPPDLAPEVARGLHEDVVRHGFHCTCGNIGYRHCFYALADYGYTEDVLRILRNPEYPGWGYMLANGATTVWERWEAEMQNEMHSFDHPMFGSYDAFLYRYLAGIEVEEDAFACDRVRIDPRFPRSLDHAGARFDTLRGRVSSSWRRSGGKVTLELAVPPTVRATVLVRGTLDGQPFEPGRILPEGRYRIEDAEEAPRSADACTP